MPSHVSPSTTAPALHTCFNFQNERILPEAHNHTVFLITDFVTSNEQAGRGRLFWLGDSPCCSTCCTEMTPNRPQVPTSRFTALGSSCHLLTVPEALFHNTLSLPGQLCKGDVGELPPTLSPACMCLRVWCNRMDTASAMFILQTGITQRPRGQRTLCRSVAVDSIGVHTWQRFDRVSASLPLHPFYLLFFFFPP